MRMATPGSSLQAPCRVRSGVQAANAASVVAKQANLTAAEAWFPGALGGGEGGRKAGGGEMRLFQR